MKPYTLALLVALLAIGTSEGLFLNKPAPPETSLIEDMKNAAQDLKDSASLKQKAIVGAVTAVSNAKHRLINQVQETKVGLLKNIASQKAAVASAIRERKVALIKGILAAKMTPIMRKIQLVKNIRDFGSQMLFHHKSETSDKGSASGLLGGVVTGLSKGPQKEENPSKDDKYVFVSVPQQPVLYVGSYPTSVLPVMSHYEPFAPEPRNWLPVGFQIPSNPITSILRPVIPAAYRPQPLPPASQSVISGIATSLPSVNPESSPVILAARPAPLPPTLQLVEAAQGGSSQTPCDKPAELEPSPLPPVQQTIEQISSSNSKDESLSPEPLPPVKETVESVSTTASSPLSSSVAPESVTEELLPPEPLGEPAVVYEPLF